MARPTQEINLTPEEVCELAFFLFTSPVWATQKRTLILLASACGLTGVQIKEKYNVSEVTISKVRRQFLRQRLDALNASCRTGRPPKYNAEIGEQILTTIQKNPPFGRKSWNGHLIADELGISRDFVWRFLRQRKICLQRRRKAKFTDNNIHLPENIYSFITDSDSYNARLLKIHFDLLRQLEEIRRDIQRFDYRVNIFEERKELEYRQLGLEPLRVTCVQQEQQTSSFNEFLDMVIYLLKKGITCISSFKNP